MISLKHFFEEKDKIKNKDQQNKNNHPQITTL
jgi:hypothetical protein